MKKSKLKTLKDVIDDNKLFFGDYTEDILRKALKEWEKVFENPYERYSEIPYEYGDIDHFYEVYLFIKHFLA